MKLKFGLILFIVCLVSSFTITQCVSQKQKKIMLINRFLLNVKNDSLDTKGVIESFMYKTNDSNYLKFQEIYIPFLKRELRKIDIDKISIKPYSQLPTERRTIIDQSVDDKQIYVLFYNDTIFHNVLIEDNRIKSFTTMTFGKNKTFMY